MHELESLLLVDPDALKSSYPGRHRAIEALESTQGMPPEEINDAPTTAPSKRLIQHVPEYEGDKVSVAPGAIAAIGLPRLRAACPHFDAWIHRLEGLTTAGPIA